MFYIGVDIGTTSTKSVLYTKSGEIKATHHIEYPLLTPSPEIAEQEPEVIFDAVLMTIKHVIHTVGAKPEEIQLISFSSAMHSLLVMDETNKAITNSITWADNRSSEQAKLIHSEFNGLEIYKRTGTPIHPMSPLCKIMWMKQHDPNTFNHAHKFIGIKGYVFYQLFERYIEDYSILSATGLFNIHQLDYDKDVLQLLGIQKSQLSEAVDTTTVLSGCKEIYCTLLGISKTTKFVIGASDGVLSNLGVDAIQPGEVAVTIGTSGAIRTVVNQPKIDEHGRLFCYALTKDQWVIGGPVNNGGVILRWIRDELAASEMETAKRLGIEAYDVLMEIAKRVPPGSDGLLFHPFLAGERAPYWNSDVRGSFIGLTLRHQKEHMIRSSLEGVIFNLYTVFIALTVLMDEEVKTLKATGGFAKSPLWRQMMSDIFESVLIVPKSIESSCLGAVVLGMKAIGEIDDFNIVSEMVGQSTPHYPIHEHVVAYRKLLPIYMNIVKQLDSTYTALSKIQREQ